MKIGDNELDELFPDWFWWVGIGLAVSCATLVGLYYLLHPERNLLDDFARKPFIPNDLSGLVDASPGPGDEAPPGT
jgi:hypothetical protein